MALSEINGNFHFKDRLSCGELDIPAGTIVNADVNASAGISASKLQHQHVLSYQQPVTADTITAGTWLLHICRGAGLVRKVEVSSAVAPTTDTDYFTIDVKKVRAGVSASVLSAVATYNNTNALAGDGGDVNGNYGIVVGAIDGAEDDTVDNDILEVVVTDDDGVGVQASGCVVNVTIIEAY